VDFGDTCEKAGNELNEVGLAEDLLITLSDTQDVDVLLNEDPELYTKYSARAEALLVQANYSATDFRKFAKRRATETAARLDGAARLPFSDML
jgi:hypothetical protein